MAFVSESIIAIGNALERAYFELINAREAKAQDEETMLWHTYKAQRCLKEAAALLVERQPIENLSSSLRGKAEAINDVEPPKVEQSGTFDSHEASASRYDALYGNEQSPQCEHAAKKPDDEMAILQEWLDVTNRIIVASSNRETMRKELISYIGLNIVKAERLQKILSDINQGRWHG